MDWETADLVVFGLEGTLYDQEAVRREMLAQMFASAIRSRSLREIRIVKAYCEKRDILAEAGIPAFERVLVAWTAAACGVGAAAVQRTVDAWLQDRPLPCLEKYRFDGILALFTLLRARRTLIAVLSDDPAEQKLARLGLRADLSLSASEVSVLKPHPRGVLKLAERAGVPIERVVMVGDRMDRDGMAALRAGARALVRSRWRLEGVCT